MARIAILGASGFVARHLVPLLLEDGHEVRGLARSTPRGAASGTVRGFTFVPGDIRHQSHVRSVMDGCSIAVHLAASFSPEDDTQSIIVDGTSRVVDAAREAGITRLIYLSCLGSDASSPSAYYSAKWSAESLVRGAGVSHVILRPSLIVGRDDGVLRPLAEVVRRMPIVPVPGRGDERQQPLDVTDLARCIHAALTSDTVKDSTVSLGGPMFITFRQMIDLLSGELGLRRPKALVPLRLLPALIRLLPVGSRALYLEPREAQFEHGVVTSPGMVERAFGFQPASILTRLSGYIA